MKRITIVALTMFVCVITFLQPVSAQEISGDIIRNLMSSVDNQMSALEEISVGLQEEKQQILSEMREHQKAFQETKDPVEREMIKADAMLANARINEMETKEVGAILKTVTNVVPQLKKLKAELYGVTNYNLDEEFTVCRKKAGKFMTNAAHILSNLKATASKQDQRDLEFMEQNLVGILAKWDSPLIDTQNSVAQIEQTINDLEETFASLIVIERLLKQEKTKLKVMNNIALVNLFNIRLGGGELAADAVVTKPMAIRASTLERSKIMDSMLAESSPFETRNISPAQHRTTSDQDALSRIRTGSYGW